MLLLAILSATAQQSGYSKMSEWVRQAADSRQQAAARSAIPKSGSSMGWLITAFVQTGSEKSDRLLASYGCRVYAQLDDIAIATIPLNRLSELADNPMVKRIEAGRPASATMDTMPKIIHTLPLYQDNHLWQPYTGEGVVVGVMDIGFDLTHPNFYSDDRLSRYRIAAFWDQLSKDTVGSPFPVGRDFVGYENVLAQRRSYDGLTETHGTHTSGIAAGSGYDTPYRGVAFGSDLCLVSNAVSSDLRYIDQTDYYKYTTATDALGFKYMFDYADSQGKPCVASFSEGYMPYYDEDDSLYCAFLDKLSTPGHIIVSAAGNEGAALTYAEKAPGTFEAGAFIRSYSKEASYRIKHDGPIALRFYAYGNGSIPTDTIVFESRAMRLDSAYTDTLFLKKDTCTISIKRYASGFSADSIFLLNLASSAKMHEMLPVAMVMQGADTHAEIYGSAASSLAYRDVDKRWNAAQYGRNILAPSNFPCVICVGSTAHRTGFVNYKGIYKDYSEGRTVGKRTPFSSIGPTMTGLLKPDVMAPGENVVSSYSSFYLGYNPTANDLNSDVARFVHEGRVYSWNSNSGTSMSCPVAAGVIALWLQANPKLTHHDVRDIFSRTCAHPDAALDYPNNEYGYGEINAYLGLLDILGISKVEAVSQHQPRQALVRVGNGALQLQFASVPKQTVTVSIYSVAGARLLQTKLKPSGTEASIDLPRLPAGVYAVQLSCADSSFAGSQLIRL